MRVLSRAEEVRYLTAAAKETIDLADIATIMVLQGPRPDEVMSLEQTHVDLANPCRSRQSPLYDLGHQRGRQIQECASEVEDVGRNLSNFRETLIDTRSLGFSIVKEWGPPHYSSKGTYAGNSRKEKQEGPI